GLARTCRRGDEHGPAEVERVERSDLERIEPKVARGHERRPDGGIGHGAGAVVGVAGTVVSVPAGTVVSPGTVSSPGTVVAPRSGGSDVGVRSLLSTVGTGSGWRSRPPGQTMPATTAISRIAKQPPVRTATYRPCQR